MSLSRMPVLFIGHGSPMNAIEENEFSRSWIEAGGSLPQPRGILCVSAHWETDGARITAMEQPKTIYDFYGFPPELYAATYPAPGSPELARRVQDLLGRDRAALDMRWGLDHGAWSVLLRLFPRADVPVVQLSLDVQMSMQEHYELGRNLKTLREEDVLILGSGNMVHNLRMVIWEDTAYDWAEQYDDQVRGWILEDDHESIINYERHGRAAALAVNSAEHYKPLLYVLGAKEPGETVEFFADKVTYGSLSMRSVRIG